MEDVELITLGRMCVGRKNVFANFKNHSLICNVI